MTVYLFLHSVVLLSIYTLCACSPRSNSHEHLLALEVITQLPLYKSFIYFVITEIYLGKWLFWKVNLFLYSVVQNRTNITNLQISKQCFCSNPHSVLSWNNSGDFKWKGTWVKAGLPLCTLSGFYIPRYLILPVVSPSQKHILSPAEVFVCEQGECNLQVGLSYHQ